MANETKQKAPRRYEKMRDSGVEWIGMVPEGWHQITIKRLIIMCDGGAWGEDAKGAANDRICMRVADFNFATGRFKEQPESLFTVRNYQPEVIGKLTLEKGDILIEKSGGGALTPVGRSVIFDKNFPAIYANFLERIRVDTSKTLPEYVEYWLRAMYYHGATALYIKQTTGIQNLDITRLLSSECIVFPNIEQQRSLIDYLDKKTASVDEIIAEAKASIEECKAWKSSIIYEAVTKGLDPTAEMKDSGVEWIGKIPAHWAFGKIKQVAQFAPKCDFSRLKDDALITFTPMECIRNGYFENRGKQLNTITGSYTPYSEGDIVFAKVTPCFENGNICIMKNLYSGMGLGSSELFVLRAHFINTEYLFYYLQHPGFVQRACASMTGTGGLKRVSSDFVQNCPLPIPPEEEQHKIVDFLNRRCTAIEQLISDKNVLIEELESYKKSLIHEVVTGKRKVV